MEATALIPSATVLEDCLALQERRLLQVLSAAAGWFYRSLSLEGGDCVVNKIFHLDQNMIYLDDGMCTYLSWLQRPANYFKQR